MAGSGVHKPRRARAHSSVLAGRIENAFEEKAPLDAYEVRLSDEGELVWIERRDSQEVRHTTELGTSVLLRAGVWFLSHLPIEWLL